MNPASPTPATIAHAVGRLATLLDGLPRGDLAELRRMDPGDTLPPATWRLLTEPPVTDACRALARGDDIADAERAFAILIAAMAETGLADRQAPRIGEALRGDPQSGDAYSEDRFVRLLRARGIDETGFHVRLAARWCSVKGRVPRFAGRSAGSEDRVADNEFGPFILFAALNDDEEAKRRAHAIARDYFSQHIPETA
jgi:hypothetical protein